VPVDAATAAARWVQSASGAQTRFTDGVQGTSKDPTALAIAQQAKLLAGFQQAVNSGRWASNLRKIGAAGWKAATVAKAANYTTGVSASEQKYAAAIAPVLQVIASIQSQLQSMPSTSLADNLARSNFANTTLYNWKRSQ
jgi:hypothetical protein